MSEIDFNTSPYFDDYDESKNFHRILFKPGISVQARELTQLQTILQKQIERHGSHVFKEGANVVGGELSLVPEFRGIQVDSKNGTFNVADYADQLIGKTIVGEVSGVQAIVVAISEETETDPLILHVSYSGAGNDKTTLQFQDGENLTTTTAVSTFVAGERVAKAITENAAVTGIGCSISTGIYYTKGVFVRVEPQTLVVSKSSKDVDARIGLAVVESIVSSVGDASLLDNATGSPNFAAPGADRWAIDLTLTSTSLDTSTSTNFIELDRIRNGRLQGKLRGSEYSVLAENLARRTEDMNGSVEVEPFDLKIKESLNDFENTGVYSSGETTTDGNVASESLMALQVSSGKAYVEGYRLETVGSVFVDVNKARDFATINSTVATMEVGNYVRIKNLTGVPDIVALSGSITNYPVMQLRDEFTDSDGLANGNIIGYARPRSMEFDAGDQGSGVDAFDSDATFKLHLFDVNMITELALDSDAYSANIPTGTRIKGVNSFATGFVDSSSTAGLLRLVDVSGTFLPNEELFTNNYDSAGDGFKVRNSGNTADVTVSSVSANTFGSVKQIFWEDGSSDFSADLELESEVQLSGSVSITGGTAALSGFNTLFTSELRVGDAIAIPSGTSGALETLIVQSITDDTNITLSSNASNTITSTAVTRLRAISNDQDKFISIRKLAKDFTKDVSNKAIEVRRQFVGTTNASGIVSFTATGGTFNAQSNTDYQITIEGAGTGSALVGDVINTESSNLSITGEGTDTLTLTSASLFGDACDIKITTTVRYGSVSSKTKTDNVATLVRALNKKNNTGTKDWGTSAHHEEVSLGFADAHTLLAVYDSLDPTTDASLPSMTLSAASGAFTDREIVVGGTSGASAIAIGTSSPLEYVPLSDLSFVAGETITGQTSSETATIDTLTDGSANITNRFLLDNGQRDNYYGISKLVRRAKSAAPAGRILVVFSYYSHGSGEFLDVNSYSSIDYKDIPFYTSSRIDPEVRGTGGLYDLRSVIDYRPRVADASSTLAGGEYTVTGKSIDLSSRAYSGTGSAVSSTPKDNSNFTYDLEHYLPRIDSLFLTSRGEFVVVEGTSAEIPRIPNEIPAAIKLCDISMNPYVIDIEDDVQIQQINYKNYKKKDIALLEQRIDNIEYYTSLTLLETSASQLQIKDADGFDRFKSGFLVDEFGGHKTGNPAHQDYSCSIDYTNAVLRPKQANKNITLKELRSTNALRSLDGYQRTGNIITLPYTDVASIDQSFATRVENVNPLLNYSWTGNIAMIPSADEWFDTEYLPDVTRNEGGNFNAVLASTGNVLGTVWNSVTQEWAGTETSTRERTIRNSEITERNENGRAIAGRRWLSVTSETVETSSTTVTRQGIRTSIAERIDTRLEGDREVSRELIPFMRSRPIRFEASGLRPFTRVYPFFDNVDVSSYCAPISGSVAGTPVQRSVTTAGSWNSSLFSIDIKDFWLHNHLLGAKTISVETSKDGVSYNQIDTTSLTSRVKSDLTFTVGDGADVAADTIDANLKPNDDGDLWVKLIIDQVEHFAWSDVQFFGDDGVSGGSSTQIPKTIIELVSFENATKDTSSTDWTFRSPDADVDYNISEAFSDYSYQLGAVEVVFKIRDGAKTTVPESGTVPVTNNATIAGDALVTDGTGRVSGVFTIPDPNITGTPKFRTGERTFRLTTSATNSETGVETFAEGNFTATGVLINRQRTFVATRRAEIVTTPVTVTETISQSRVVGRNVVVPEIPGSSFNWRQPVWEDPLGQTFQIVSQGGEFLTKVDIFFSTKDDNIPVELQLREVENGTITSRIVPMSRVVKKASDVQTSVDGTVATTFTFESPIYVAEGVELAMVLLSSSQNYTVFISRMGEANLTDGAVVSDQPYLGVLFKSQNNSTWTAYDFEDLKFTLYRAQFDTNVSGTFRMINQDIAPRKLSVDPIESFANSTTLKISHNDHQMYSVTNKVTIDGATSGTFANLSAALNDSATSLSLTGAGSFPDSGETVSLRLISTDRSLIDENDIYGDELSEIVLGTMTGTGSTRTVTGLTRARGSVSAQNFDNGSQVELYQYNGFDLINVNTTHDITDYGMDYYTVAVSGDSAVSDLVFGGSNVTATENALINNYQLMVPSIQHPSTTLSPTITLVSGTSASGTESSFVTLSEEGSVVINNVELTTPSMVASDINETTNVTSVAPTGSKSCVVKFTMSSTADNLSPVVDIERASLIAQANRVDNIQSSADFFPTSEYVGPTSAEGDVGEAIYMTKQATLVTPATALKIYLNANVMEEANLQVMYKVLSSGSSVNFEDVGWTYFNTDGSPDTVVNDATDSRQFQEYEYSVNELDEFISFAIKIKMNGTNSSLPPKVKDLRAIAIAV